MNFLICQQSHHLGVVQTRKTNHGTRIYATSRSIFAMQLTHVTHVMKIATTACFSGTSAKQQGN